MAASANAGRTTDNLERHPAGWFEDKRKNSGDSDNGADDYQPAWCAAVVDQPPDWSIIFDSFVTAFCHRGAFRAGNFGSAHVKPVESSLIAPERGWR